MKIAHLADSHLGNSAYRKISESGFNQREEDVILAFVDAIDKVIAMRPDVVLHSGDLFDTVRPTNRIIRIGIQQLLRLYEAKLPLVLITGNHETPKQLFKGSVYSILEALPLENKLEGTDIKLFNIAYQEKYEVYKFSGLTVHAVPQCTDDKHFREELAKIKKDPTTKNVLMLHTGISDMDEFSHVESNELLVDSNWLNKMNFDYVALGHYHGYVRVAKNSWFSGSSERMSFNEVGSAKGFVTVDLDDTDKNGEVRTKLIPVRTRPMIDMAPIDGTGKDSVVLLDEILAAIKKVDPNGKLLRLSVKNIPQHVMNALDTKKIREAAKDAVHFEPRYERITEEGKIESVKLVSGGIKEEFNSFLKEIKDLSEKDRSRFNDIWTKEYEEIMAEDE